MPAGRFPCIGVRPDRDVASRLPKADRRVAVRVCEPWERPWKENKFVHRQRLAHRHCRPRRLRHPGGGCGRLPRGRRWQGPQVNRGAQAVHLKLSVDGNALTVTSAIRSRWDMHSVSTLPERVCHRRTTERRLRGCCICGGGVCCGSKADLRNSVEVPVRCAIKLGAAFSVATDRRMTFAVLPRSPGTATRSSTKPPLRTESGVRCNVGIEVAPFGVHLAGRVEDLESGSSDSPRRSTYPMNSVTQLRHDSMPAS